MEAAHVISQPIVATQLPCDAHGDPIDYVVGKHGITRIEACAKGGEFCDIPYLRVWAGERCVAEFSQHKASFVFFDEYPGMTKT